MEGSKIIFFKLIIKVLISICLLAFYGEAWGQETDVAVIQSIRYEVDQLLVTPLDVNSEQAIYYNLNVIMAYHDWVDQKPYSPYMPVAKKFDYFYNKARSEFLYGTHQTIAMMLYAPTGSEVFPLLDYAIAHLDTASYHYRQVNKYAVSSFKEQLKADSTTAIHLSDTLKHIRSQIFRQNSFEALRTFKMEELLQQIFQNRQPIPPRRLKSIEGSISGWLYNTYLE